MIWKKMLCMTICCLVSIFCLAQAELSKSDKEAYIESVREAFPEPTGSRSIYKSIAEQKTSSEIKYFLSSLFLFYKHYISSQDGQKCSFHPSCSEYSMLAIKKQGVFLGVLNGFDRLTRCNGLSPENYEINPDSGKLFDPVE